MIDHPDLSSVRTDLKAAIVDALRRHFVSTSSHMNYTTGNAYQSVTLDGETLPGYRIDRSRLFDCFDFKGLSVVDCGCNLGELSRLSRARGAYFVDGIEYEPLFVQIGNMINAYHNTTRVSLQQKDLIAGGAFEQQYDIALAFSVFPYICPILPDLSAATKRLLILETHNVTSDLHDIYLDQLKPFFPFHNFIGTSDLGHGQGERYVLALGRDIRELASPGGIVESDIDIGASTLPFLQSFKEALSMPLQAYDSAQLRPLIEIHQDHDLVTAGVRYWLEFYAGYLQYREAGFVSERNGYCVYLKSLLERTDFDPALTYEMRTPSQIVSRVMRRFKDGDAIANGSEKIIIDPIVIFHSGSEGLYRVKRTRSDAVVNANLLDGYHRLFWALMFERNIPAIVELTRESTKCWLPS